MTAQFPSDAIIPSSPGTPVGTPPDQSAGTCMSAPVRTVLSRLSLGQAHQILLRYGHSALCVIDDDDCLVGVLTRRDIDVALRHGLAGAPVYTCMDSPVQTITPETPLADVQSLMTTYGVGCLPVLAAGELVGVVTRSDVLRQLHCANSARDLSGKGLSGRDSSVWSELASVPAASVLLQQLVQRSGWRWTILQCIAEVAKDKGWAIYVVGGAVRDLLLSHLGQSSPLMDIDLVVDAAQSGTGVTLAAAVQARYPQVDLQTYGQFQTAALTWPAACRPAEGADDSSIPSLLPAFTIDIATARTEYYPYPAANPEVESSTIHQDLYRRDFTINAMALRLDGDHAGELLDFFGGWIDLQQRCVRVIHPNSFLEDPTRIFRAVRFATRLNCEISPHNQRLIASALHSGVYSRMRASGQKMPALQSRLSAELKKLLGASQWEAALAQLDPLGALTCIHPNLTISTALWPQLRRLARWQTRFAAEFVPAQPRWLLLLALLLVQLGEGECDRAAATLNLDEHIQIKLRHFHQREAALLPQLTQVYRPSEIYQHLQPYGQFELLLIAVRHPYTLAAQIWQYIVRLSRMPPLINGGTLKRLGYLPGPQFREILAAVHQLQLNDELRTAQAAETYVLAQYPLDDPLDSGPVT